MKNYNMLIKEIILSRLNIRDIDCERIVEIKFKDYGVDVYYEYWWKLELLNGNDIIYNSEINAYVFEHSFNK